MKPNKPVSRERLEHILDCIGNIRSFVEGYSLDSYDYPWYQVKSFRNFIMHEYHAVDAGVVWDTIQLVLPEFSAKIQEILADEFD